MFPYNKQVFVENNKKQKDKWTSKEKYRCGRCNNKGHNFKKNVCGNCRSTYVMKIEGEK